MPRDKAQRSNRSEITGGLSQTLNTVERVRSKTSGASRSSSKISDFSSGRGAWAKVRSPADAFATPLARNLAVELAAALPRSQWVEARQAFSSALASGLSGSSLTSGSSDQAE